MQWDDIQTRVSGMLRYLWEGKSRYHIHSPFVFDLVNKVLRDKRRFYDLDVIQEKRLGLLNDKSTLDISEANDPGAIKHVSIASLTRRTAIPQKYGELLFRLANHYSAHNILEVGTGLGVSMAYMACASKTGHIIGLEGDKARAEIADRLLQQLNCSHVSLRVGNFEDTLLQAVHDLGQIDMAFLDGNHQQEPTLRYFETLLPALHSKSLVVVDDIYWSADMQAAWQQLKQHPRVTLSIDLYRLGILFFNPDFKQSQHHRLYY